MSVAHGRPQRGQNLIVAALVAVLLIAAVSFVLVYSGIPLCFACPTTTQYNPSGSQHTDYNLGTNGVATSTTLTGGTSIWPIGSAYTQFSISNQLGQSFGTWLVTMPNDQSTGPSSTYVFSSTYSGTAFLTNSNDPSLWATEGPSMNGQNPFVVNSTFTSTTNAPTACNSASTTNTCKVTWFINRYFLTVDMKVQNAGIYIACAPGATCQGYSCIFNLCNNSAYDSAFQAGFLTELAQVNSVSKLTSPTSLSLQLNIPPLPGGQSNLDYAGILALWTAPACTTGGGGIANGDLCTTGCQAPAACSISVTAPNTPLPLYIDGGLQNKYQPTCNTYLNAASYTASQLASACSASLSSQVYTTIPITSFGAGFSQGPSYNTCGIGNFGACWTVSQPEAVLTLVLDVLTSYHVYTQAPTPTPTTGTGAGTFTGRVVDGSLFWNPAVPGAQVCLTDITGCAATNATGGFTLTNLPAGQHTFQVTAPGYVSTSPQLSISLSSGQTTNIGTVQIAETNPWYTGALCVYTNPLGQCQFSIPWLLIFTIAGVIVLLVAIVAFVYSAPARTASKIVNRFPHNPPTKAARGFIARKIATNIREGHSAKQAQAIAFSQARKAGYNVPPPPQD